MTTDPWKHTSLWGKAEKHGETRGRPLADSIQYTKGKSILLPSLQRELSIGYSGKSVKCNLVKNATIVQKMFKTANRSNTEARGDYILVLL